MTDKKTFSKETIENTTYAVGCSKEQAIIILEEIERQKDLEVHLVLSDLIMYANHLKQNNFSLELLITRIKNRQCKKQEVRHSSQA